MVLKRWLVFFGVLAACSPSEPSGFAVPPTSDPAPLTIRDSAGELSVEGPAVPEAVLLQDLPLEDGGRLLLKLDGELERLNPAGVRLWTVPAAGLQIWVRGPVVLQRLWDGSFQALSLEDGQAAWRTESLGPAPLEPRFSETAPWVEFQGPAGLYRRQALVGLASWAWFQPGRSLARRLGWTPETEGPFLAPVISFARAGEVLAGAPWPPEVQARLAGLPPVPKAALWPPGAEAVWLEPGQQTLVFFRWPEGDWSLEWESDQVVRLAQWDEGGGELRSNDAYGDWNRHLDLAPEPGLGQFVAEWRGPEASWEPLVLKLRRLPSR